MYYNITVISRTQFSVTSDTPVLRESSNCTHATRYLLSQMSHLHRLSRFGISTVVNGEVFCKHTHIIYI